MVYIDGSRDDEGRVSGGWFADGNGAGSVAVGNVATIWDAEVAVIHQALRMAPDVDILVLKDSKASFLASKMSPNGGRGCIRDLAEVVDEVGRRTQVGLRMPFDWVKAHVGIEGNKCADRMAKAGYRESVLPQVTEGGLQARWKNIRSRERAIFGLGTRWEVHWNRRAVLRYTQLRVGKGDMGAPFLVFVDTNV